MLYARFSALLAIRIELRPFFFQAEVQPTRICTATMQARVSADPLQERPAFSLAAYTIPRRARDQLNSLSPGHTAGKLTNDAVSPALRPLLTQAGLTGPRK